MAFWETGAQEFFQSEKLVLLPEDLVLISSTADYALLPHFLDTFFIAPLIAGCREISAVGKGSSEAQAVTVEGICCRPFINTELAHCILVPQCEEYCSCPIETGDKGRQREAGGFRHPVSEFLGASVSPGC